jgi:hypothetical protein
MHLRLTVVSRWKKERLAYDYNRTIAKHLVLPLTSRCRRSKVENLRDSVLPFNGHGDDRQHFLAAWPVFLCLQSWLVVGVEARSESYP